QNNAGTYRVRVSKATCFADATIQIIKAPIPLGQLIDRAIICADRDNLDPATNQIDLNPGRFVSYNWFKDGNTLGYTNQIFTAGSEGLYRVDLTNSFGCINSDETEVLNECVPKIVGPNAFRPGSNVQYTTRLGTYSNREFFVYSFFVTDNFEVAIYNRWGELVFQSKDRGFKWNGGYDNNPSQPLPGGTYTYVIRYESSFRPQDGVKEQRGGVVLLR
ncbi:MAG: gliding motility-associated C-terminal domain-containing protein, partial [Cytophagales bacterium]